MGAPYFISASELSTLVGRQDAPLVIDVRRMEKIVESGLLVPGSIIRPSFEAEQWADVVPHDRSVVVTCVHGHERSQYAAAVLRSRGIQASVLRDGFDGWMATHGLVVKRSAGPLLLGEKPTCWITRRRPKIDRVACPWLIRRFLDPQAEFLFAEPDDVEAIARHSGAVGFDYPGAPFEHDGPLCSFDVMLREFGLHENVDLQKLALIIRAADTDRLDLAPQAAGLFAISLGYSSLCGDDDLMMLSQGMVLYDGLWGWIQNASQETHNWPRAK